jgi:hypothetical protein
MKQNLLAHLNFDIQDLFTSKDARTFIYKLEILFLGCTVTLMSSIISHRFSRMLASSISLIKRSEHILCLCYGYLVCYRDLKVSFSTYFLHAVTGRSRVRIPMLSLEFLSDIILLVALWPWG